MDHSGSGHACSACLLQSVVVDLLREEGGRGRERIWSHSEFVDRRARATTVDYENSESKFSS
jgi:hypothetical protein